MPFIMTFMCHIYVVLVDMNGPNGYLMTSRSWVAGRDLRSHRQPESLKIKLFCNTLVHGSGCR